MRCRSAAELWIALTLDPLPVEELKPCRALADDEVKSDPLRLSSSVGEFRALISPPVVWLSICCRRT